VPRAAAETDCVEGLLTHSFCSGTAKCLFSGHIKVGIVVLY